METRTIIEINNRERLLVDTELKAIAYQERKPTDIDYQTVLVFTANCAKNLLPKLHTAINRIEGV